MTITAWKLDLFRILHVFNVRSVASAWSRLTVRFQTELAINTNVAVSKVRYDIMKTDTDAVKPDTNAIKTDTNAVKTDTNATKIGTAKPDTTVPRTRRTVVRRQKGTDSKKRSVSVTCSLFITEPTLTTP